MFDWIDEYDNFCKYGVGAMAWGQVNTDKGSHRVLYVLVPDLHHNAQATLLCLYVEHDNNDWTHEGPVKGWNGNVEHPTLHPSIQVLDADGNPTGWHGFVVAGGLVDA